MAYRHNAVIEVVQAREATEADYGPLERAALVSAFVTPPVPRSLSAWLRELKAAFSMEKVWLFGSRANGCARSDSDWDLIVCGDKGLRTASRADAALRRDDIDLDVFVRESKSDTAWLLWTEVYFILRFRMARTRRR